MYYDLFFHLEDNGYLYYIFHIRVIMVTCSTNYCNTYKSFNSYIQEIMGTWQIIAEGVQTFAPVTSRLYEIAMELIHYFIYITLWRLWICLVRWAVKYILWTLTKKSNETVREINDKPQLEFWKHYIVQNWKVIREETEEERITREEDEARNRQNPYYDPSWW